MKAKLRLTPQQTCKMIKSFNRYTLSFQSRKLQNFSLFKKEQTITPFFKLFFGWKLPSTRFSQDTTSPNEKGEKKHGPGPSLISKKGM
jgi:hypothetical protein